MNDERYPSTPTIVVLSILEGFVAAATLAVLFGAIAASIGDAAWVGALWCAPIVLGCAFVYVSLTSFQSQLELRDGKKQDEEGQETDE